MSCDLGSRAFQIYRLITFDDGAVCGTCWTNDNLDKGHPSEEATWDVRFVDYAHMKKATGLSHTGISGITVDVFLDGNKI